MFRYIFLAIFISQSLLASNLIKSANWSKDESKLTVTFKNKVEHVKPWNFYNVPSKQHKYIYDIDNTIVKNGHLNFKQNKLIDKIVIGQFRKNRLRITFRNEKKLNISYKIHKNKMIFDFHIKKKFISKKPKKSKPKPKQKQKPEIEIYELDIKENVTDRKRKVITIDAGHGGKDGGAVFNKLKIIEKKIVLKIAKYTEEYLKKLGYTVYMTRSKDNFISLGKRTKFANGKKSDLFISIHANSLPKKGRYQKKNGIETYFLSPARTDRAKRVASKENHQDLNIMSKYGKNNYLTSLSREKIILSHKLAIDIQSGVINRLRKYYYHIENGGVKPAPFWVLVGAQMPAVLLEIGYVTGDRDGKRLMDRLYTKRLAKGISLGVEEYFKKN